jgi:hypothetical protein
MERPAERGHFPTFRLGLNALKSLPRPSFRNSAWRAIVFALVAVLLGVGGWVVTRPTPPEVLALRKRANDNGLKAKLWASYAKLSDEGVTRLDPIHLADGGMGGILGFNHFQPRPRPTDPAEADAFDRDNAATAAKCRRLQDYYDRLRVKWERAASRPDEFVIPDPPPPVNIEPSSFQDIAF